MKKVITFVITFVLLFSFVFPFASADESTQRKYRKKFITITRDEILDAYLAFLSILDDYDDSYLSSLSYEKLLELKNQINLLMWKSQKWQEVTVPTGVWEVGKDIPVGKWNISIASDSPDAWGTVVYCDKLDGSGLGANPLYCKIYHYEQLFSKTTDTSLCKSIDIDCQEGTYIIIDYGSMLFTPSIGKPDLGFK